MTLDVTGRIATPKAGARHAERGRDVLAEARGFDEALASGDGKRRPPDAGAPGRTEPVASFWKARAYAPGPGLGIATAPVKAPREDEPGEAMPLPDMPDLVLPGTWADAGAGPAAALDAGADAAVVEQPPANALPVAATEKTTADDRGAQVAATTRAEPDPAANAPATAGPARARDSRAEAVADAAAAPLPALAQAAPAQTRRTGDVEASPRQERRPDRAQTAAQDGPATTAARVAGEPVPQAQPAREPSPQVTAPRRQDAAFPQVHSAPEPAEQAAAPRREDIAPQTRAPRETFSAGPANDAPTGRVSVLGFSSAPAPAPTFAPLLGATSAGVVAAIGAEPSWRQAAAEPAHSSDRRAAPSPAGASTLRIQLNPAELGIVTARLTATGSQLSIEIQVESSDARQRLAGDSDAIVKALRAIGFDIDKVTIQQQPQQGGQPGTQANAGGGRDHFQAGQQPREDTAARGQGGRDGTGSESGGNGYGQGEATAGRSGGGVYI